MTSIKTLIRWITATAVVLAVLLVGTGTAQAADGAVLSPDRAKGIALGLIDATGPLAVQCGLGKVGDRIRAGSVAADAAKESLAISGAKSSCSGVKNIAEAIGVIVVLAEAGQPVYVSLSQSQKNKWWGAGLVKTCSVTVRAGASASLARNFTASFTCH